MLKIGRLQQQYSKAAKLYTITVTKDKVSGNAKTVKWKRKPAPETKDTWNLIEHSLRLYIKENETTLPGWDKKKTRRPTAFMVSTKLWGSHLSELL